MFLGKRPALVFDHFTIGHRKGRFYSPTHKKSPLSDDKGLYIK